MLYLLIALFIVVLGVALISVYRRRSTGSVRDDFLVELTATMLGVTLTFGLAYYYEKGRQESDDKMAAGFTLLSVYQESGHNWQIARVVANAGENVTRLSGAAGGVGLSRAVLARWQYKAGTEEGLPIPKQALAGRKPSSRLAVRLSEERVLFMTVSVDMRKILRRVTAKAESITEEMTATIGSLVESASSSEDRIEVPPGIALHFTRKYVRFFENFLCLIDAEGEEITSNEWKSWMMDARIREIRCGAKEQLLSSILEN